MGSLPIAGSGCATYGGGDTPGPGPPQASAFYGIDMKFLFPT